jgi:hypothetical protein
MNNLGAFNSSRNSAGQHEQDFTKRLRKFDRLFCIFFSGRLCILVRMSPIVCFESDVVRPASHFFGQETLFYGFVYSIVERTFLVAFSLEHGIYRTGAAQDCGTRCMQACDRLR